MKYKLPDDFNGYEQMKPGETEFSYQSLSLVLDIADYFAEVVIKNDPSIHWGYFTKPRNRVSVNRPVLRGFKFDMDPRLIVSNCAYPSEESWEPKTLYNIYHNWLEFI